MTHLTSKSHRRGPLEGVRVLDLSTVVAGPLSTMILADQGAEVLKIEPIAGGDHGRGIGPGFPEFSALFASCNHNKRSVALNLQAAEGVAVLRRLVETTDVVVQNFRPGVAKRLGVDFDSLRQCRQDLIYASITGFGPDGPYSGDRAYDAVIQALSGLADSQAAIGGEPMLVNTIICDKAAAFTVAQAIAAALFARERRGCGEHIEVSLLEAGLAFNWPDAMWNYTFTGSDFRPGLELSQTYKLWKTRDAHVAVVFMGPSALRDWLAALEADPALAEGPYDTTDSRRARWLELEPVWTERFAAHAWQDVLDRFHALGVPAGVVRRRGELPNDPQVRHNGSIREIDHPAFGPTRVVKPGARFATFESPAPLPAPRLGEHTLAVLEEVGLSAAEIAALASRGVIGQPAPTAGATLNQGEP